MKPLLAAGTVAALLTAGWAAMRFLGMLAAATEQLHGRAAAYVVTLLTAAVIAFALVGAASWLADAVRRRSGVGIR